MTRLFKLYLHFLKLAWMRSLEYRVNFATWMIVDTGWSFLDMIFYSALISFTQVIGTWNRGQALVVIGVFRLLVIPVWGWMFASFSKIPRLISEGKLDLLLGKPVDNQFMVSVQDFSFSILPSLITGSTFTVYGLYLLRITPSFWQILLFIWLLIPSTLLMYSLYFGSVALSLYFDRLDNIYHIFPTLYDAGKYPAGIYPLLLQRIFTTILPLSLMIIVPAESLFSSPSTLNLTLFHSSTLILFILSRRLWFQGLRRYSSASS